AEPERRPGAQSTKKPGRRSSAPACYLRTAVPAYLTSTVLPSAADPRGFSSNDCPRYLAGAGAAFDSSVLVSLVVFFSVLVAEPLPPIPVSCVVAVSFVASFVASELFCVVVLLSVVLVSSARAVPTNASTSAAVSPMMNRFIHVPPS